MYVTSRAQTVNTTLTGGNILCSMSTYGEVRLRVQKLLPGVDADVRDGWISDRYLSILDKLDWQRQAVEGTIQTVAPYETGTVSLTNGSNSVTGTGTTFTSAMTGRQFTASGRDEAYTFTYVGATSGTLDRTYEGDTDTESTYSIEQPVYALPSTARLVTAVTPFDTGKPLERRSRGELLARIRVSGTPQEWALHMDSSGNLLQVILWPTPDEVTSFRVSYAIEAPAWATTSATLLPWVRPAAIIAGVQADAARRERDWNAAIGYERQFDAAILDMMRSEIFRRGPATMRLPSRFTRSVRG